MQLKEKEVPVQTPWIIYVYCILYKGPMDYFSDRLCKGYTRKSSSSLLHGSKYVNNYLAILALQEKSGKPPLMAKDGKALDGL